MFDVGFFTSRLGYVPAFVDNPSYIRERKREISASFSPCACSNCAPTKADNLMENLMFANNENFGAIMDNTFVQPRTVDLKHQYPACRSGSRKRKFTEVVQALLD
jgi:hypothetical protein